MNKLQKVFDGIRAEEELKQSTIDFLKKTIQEKNNHRQQTSLVRYRFVTVCFVMIAMCGLFSYRYFMPNGYIGLDINPSIELTVNRFDRVIDARAFNEEGVLVLKGLSLRHREYDVVTEVLMGKIMEMGYWQEGGFVSITVQVKDPSRESDMLATIEYGVNSHMKLHHTGGEVDVFSVDIQTLKQAHDEGMSVAKYLAILELQGLDLTATVDGHREQSMGEIRQIIRRHHGGHNGNGITNNSSHDSPEDDSGVTPNTTDSPNNINDSHKNGHGHNRNRRHN